MLGDRLPWRYTPDPMLEQLQERLRSQRLVIKGVFLFCLFMTFIYMPYDFLVKPFTQGIERAQEVWFGYMLRGVAAKLTEPLHWLIYAALAHGFWRNRPWVYGLSALYVLQIAIGMAVWTLIHAERGAAVAIGVACPWLALAVGIWLARKGKKATGSGGDPVPE